ncbi:MAG: ORF6N domain-containing protein [Gammaproteobacteria bacterium]|nr:ORF6N domain-containing protein [Gammaproteobacteria bacterium]
MEKIITTIDIDNIQNKIHTIRGIQVMLDYDLAELYHVETKVLNQAVKRNIQRFPDKFMFQLQDGEMDVLRSQFVTLKSASGRGQHRKYLPYAFTEQGVAMLSAILRSNVAITVSIQIMDAFVKMRKIITQNTSLINRLEKIEVKQLESDQKFDKVFRALEKPDLKPQNGIFFNGQVFDAYVFIAKLIKQARASIILIDNYIDESVLTLLTKRNKKVSVMIYTKNISKKLELDLKKYNEQYPTITIKAFKDAHDRFLILDNADVYHLGASLKDLGKKWFAFSKLDRYTIKMLNKLDKVI